MRANLISRLPALVPALVIGALLATAAPGAWAEQGTAQISIAIYAPTATFPDSSARLAYVQGLARAIQQKTGIATAGKAYVRYDDLRKANPDFAIIDGLCVASRKPGTLLAVASVGGDVAQRWALFTRAGDSFASLKGKKLSYVKTGCRDTEFLENAMLESEVKVGFFGGLVDKPDVAGAVAAVKDYKAADAVFSPVGQAKGLTKIFDSGSVPAPGFVALTRQGDQGLVDKVREAVLSYGAGGGIDGWKAASQAQYDSLTGRMGSRVKRPVFAIPEVVRLEDEDVLVVPESEFEQASVRQHFWEPPARRQ